MVAIPTGNYVGHIPSNISESRRGFAGLTNTPIAGGQLPEPSSSRFVLVDRFTRQTIAELVDVVTPNGSGLIMYHQDASTSDSVLRWSRGNPGFEEVSLRGPNSVSSNYPSLLLQYSIALTERLAILAAGTSSGPGFTARQGGAAASAKVNYDANIATIWRVNDILTTYTGQWAVFEVGGNYRLLLDATEFQILNRHVKMSNGQVFRAYDNGGTARDAIHPRWTDNRMYLTGGAGLTLRTNDGATTVAAGETDGSFQIPDCRITGQISLDDHFLRLRTPSDNNHLLAFSSATPTGSGIGSSGPILQGFGSVWLHTANGDKNLFLTEPSGSVFINAGAAYSNFSSREFKKNVKTLDPERALDMVRSWRPVSFDWKKSTNSYLPTSEGFISEEMAQTTRNLVNFETLEDGAEWANAINYPGTAPWLTGAIQALDVKLTAALARIDQLEAEVKDLQSVV